MAIIKKRQREVDHMIDDYIDRLPGEDYLDAQPDRIAMLSDSAASRVRRDYKRKYDAHIERLERIKKKRARMLEMLDSAIAEEESRAQECLSVIEAIDLRGKLPFDEDVVVDVIEEPKHYGIMVVKQPQYTETEEMERILGGPIY